MFPVEIKKKSLQNKITNSAGNQRDKNIMLYKWNISAFRYCVNTEFTFDAWNLTAVNPTRVDVMP